MKHMTRLDAEKIVVRLSAMTQKDMVKAMTEDEEFRRLHEDLLANGWATLNEGMEKRSLELVLMATTPPNIVM